MEQNLLKYIQNYKILHLLTLFYASAIFHYKISQSQFLFIEWVLVTTAWRVLRLRMEEWPLIWRVTSNVLNKHLWTVDEGWSFSLGVGRGANNSTL